MKMKTLYNNFSDALGQAKQQRRNRKENSAYNSAQLHLLNKDDFQKIKGMFLIDFESGCMSNTGFIHFYSQQIKTKTYACEKHRYVISRLLNK